MAIGQSKHKTNNFQPNTTQKTRHLARQTPTEYLVRNEVIFRCFFLCLFVWLVCFSLFFLSFFLSVFYLSFNVDDEGKLSFMIYDKRDFFDLVNHTFLRTSNSCLQSSRWILIPVKCYCTVCLYREKLREGYLSFKLRNLANGTLRLHLRNSLILRV